MAAELLREGLPHPWDFEVTQDGRIFFINEEARLTTWLHPVSQEPLLTGHSPVEDLPKGWEKGVTPDGIPYYINHNRQETTLVHPVTQKSAANAEAVQSPISPPVAAPAATSAAAAAVAAAALPGPTAASSCGSATLRCEATSPAPNTNTLNNNDARRAQGSSRRRSGGSWVKSPGLKRPEVSTVTLQGWLYKQGADGLHLWKKRWFVLSDYCLYYYKGPEEDKVLGSLPLPSFKISPVESEDRVYRKHAFKAEHQNMRTYYFAAETKDQMAHWMNALSLASILQKDTSLEEKWSSGSSAHRSERPSVSSLASTASPSADESDSGFHGFRSRRYRSPDGRSIDEASESSRLQGDRLNVSIDSSVVLRPGERQPLYANAPPKPKRLNNSRDYSTSPERSPEREKRDPRIYTDHGGGNGIPDGRNLHYYPQPAERRTPDAYGVAAGGGRGDYEDVYGDANGSNPMAQSTHRRSDQRDSFASSRSGGTRLSEELQLSEPLRSDFRGHDDTLPRVSHSNSHHHHLQGPPRPHSADFLEYDRKHSNNEMWSYRRGSGGDLLRANEIRPKSSVGHSELDHWSEENYAQKMRQSSLYHSHMHSRSSRYSPAGRGESPSNDQHILHNSHSAAQRVPPAGAATPDLYTSHRPTGTVTPSSATNSLRRGVALDMRHHQRADSSQDFLLESSKFDPTHESRHPPRQDTRTEPKQDLLPDSCRSFNHEEHHNRYEPSPNSTLNTIPTPPGSLHNSISPNGSLNNSFMRSASARLPRQRLQDDVMNMSLPDDGSDGDSKKMQQREESMKRLLEWKQRMLQSPLTRKTSPRPDSSTPPQPRANSEAYKQQVLNELVTQEARTKSMRGHSHTQSHISEMDYCAKGKPNSLAGLPHGYSPASAVKSQGSVSQGERMHGEYPNHNGSTNSGLLGQSYTSQSHGYPVNRLPGERPPPQGGSSQQGSDSGGSGKRRDGRRDPSRTRHVSGGDARRSTSSSRYNSYSSDEEEAKLGDSLPRRPDSKVPNSAPSQGSAHDHALAQKYQHLYSHQSYQHHPHPHSQNPYHHYKSDELHKYRLQSSGQNYQSNGPYANYHADTHGYSTNYQDDPINYPNNYRQPHTRSSNYLDSQRDDYNNTLTSQHGMNGSYRQHAHYDFQDFQDYHNYKNHQHDKNHTPEYKNQDYGTYGKHTRLHDQRLNGRLANDPHQQYSDSEITLSKQQQQQQPPASMTMTSSVPSIPLAQQDSGVEVRALQGVSAGELLGKTHEELVLLLIQLRRHHSALQAARRHARLERDSQGRLAHLDGEHRQEHFRRLASLNHHLHDLDKQYEMGKPLINLVDNMVKLGSLYRGGDARLTHDPRKPNSYHIANGYDSLQFSRRIQERRIVAEDLQLQEYELAAAGQADLEGKVMQLYKLDKNLHQESLTIQSLQREKEMLERTLVNLQSKSHGANEGPVELERRKKQRRHLEHELSKLRAHLAVSARKLEETAAENSRLEHEMMMLRQKIQMAMAKNSRRESGSSSETRHIESEMVRVQTLLEDLQRRRIELSHQIQRLTSANPGIEIRPSPTGVVGAAPVPARRRKSTWLETDLDAMITRDRGLDLPESDRRGNHPPVYVNASGYEEERVPSDYPESPEFNDADYPPPPPPPEHMRTYNHHQHLESQIPISDHLQNDSRYLHEVSSYGDFKPLMNGDIGNPIMLGLDRDAEDNKPDGEEQQHSGSHLDISDADDRMKRYYGILPKEKPLEIKTVRIVKRESTERRKDRSTTGSKRIAVGDNLTNVTEDDDVESEGASDTENEPAIPSFASRSASLPRNYGRNGPGERVSMMAAMMRTSVGNSGTMTRPSNLALKKSAGWKAKNENPKDRPMSAHEQLFGFSREADKTPPSSPSKSDPPSPVFKSAAAQQIIKEMASEAEKHRRAVPREKRRHFTISSSQPLALETKESGAEEGARSRDDCDMVRALRPRNHPDVVKSTLSSRDLRFNETTIDSVLGAPDKIYIPERYMPDEDDEKEPTEEERVHREQKAESIRKMLSETQTTVTANEVEAPQPEGEVPVSSSSAFKAKLAAEKKEREHLLALNQILARQVMEKSRVVAVRALTMLTKQPSSSDDDLSPMQPLPLVQQRENYLV